MKKIYSIIILFLILFATSCVKDITETFDKASKVNQVRWNPTIALPLVYSNLSFNDLIEGTNANNYIKIQDDSLVNLVYEDTYSSGNAEDILSLEPQNYGDIFMFNSNQLDALNTFGEVTVNFSRTISYDGDGNELDKIWFKDGAITLNLTSSFEHNISCVLTIPESQKNTSPISLDISAPYTGVPIDVNSSFDLSDSEMDFTKTAQGHSEFDIEFEFTITKTASNPIKSVESITYSMEMDKQEFSKISGYFDDLEFENLSGSFQIPVFESSKNGFISIVEPEVKFIAESSIGIPIDVSFDRFDGENNLGNSLPLTKNTGNFDLLIPQALFEGEFVQDSQVLNNSNSNLIDYISNKPFLNYYTLIVKPDLSDMSRHWLLDTSKISSTIKLTLPLHGTLKDFQLEETKPFDLALENAEEIKEVLVRLYSENGFPVNVKTQLYFEDSITNTLIDSLFTVNPVVSKAALIDSDGNPVGVSSQITDVIMESDRVDRVMNANRVRAQAYLSTTTDNNGYQPDIKIYSDDGIIIQFGVQAEVLINQEL